MSEQVNNMKITLLFFSRTLIVNEILIKKENYFSFLFIFMFSYIFVIMFYAVDTILLSLKMEFVVLI